MFTHEKFASHLGKPSRVYSSDLEHHLDAPPQERHLFSELVLHEVIDDSKMFDAKLIEIFGRSPFRLYFKGDAEIALPQAVYRFEADWHDTFEQLLVPVVEPGSPEGLYQLVFN